MLRRSRIAIAAAALACVVASAPAAQAARPPLLKVARDGGIAAVPDRLPADLPTPRSATPAEAKPKPISGAVTRAIDTMVDRRQISAEKAAESLAAWRSAVAIRKGLRGPAATPLGNAIDGLARIAAQGHLTPSRLALVTLTAQRNAEYFAKGRIPRSGQRVQFEGSDLVWQYYPGHGLQLQVLASFGIANGLWKVKLKGHLRDLLDELVALRSYRAGGVTWEYAFAFGGGNPPWTSGMSQATAVQALSRGAVLLNEPKYASLAKAALPLFSRHSPSGVRASTDRGPWYLMYSFDPSLRILNGFLQTLIGLDEMRDLTGDLTADSLFKAADPVARAAVPRYRSIGWSYYLPGKWDTFDYHSLTTGFLEELCRRTSTPVYCDTGTAFRRFMDNPPLLAVKTTRLKAGKPGAIRIWVSKPSSVSVKVIDSSGRTLLNRSTWTQPGVVTWRLRTPRGKGILTASATGSDGQGHSRTISSGISLD